MDENFLIKQREATGTELLDTITPFTTDKSVLIDKLEEDRKSYLAKKTLKSGATQ